LVQVHRSIVALYPTLERIYAELNKRKYVHPDPLEFLYRYDSLADREIAGFIASGLAYGRVAQILKSVSRILDPMGKSPLQFIMNSDLKKFYTTYSGFKHRFTTDVEVCSLMEGLKRLYGEFSSIEDFLVRSSYGGGRCNIISSLGDLVAYLNGASGTVRSSMLSDPARGSACKRHFLFLKWMTRKDDVDPGGWTRITPDVLIMPVDTHIFSIASSLGMTKRKQANLKTAIEITDAFREIVPADPTKFDFVLTRFGIRPDMNESDLLKMCAERAGSC